MKRKGLGKGQGMGYKNITPPDPNVHSMSARGIKQRQSLNPLLKKASKKQVLVGSYAEAEAQGIKPVDSIISVGTGVVFEEGDKKPPYKVLGYTQGYTFNPNEVEFAHPMKTYIVVPDVATHSGDAPPEIHAINNKIAKRIADFQYKPGFALYRQDVDYQKVK